MSGRLRLALAGVLLAWGCVPAVAQGLIGTFEREPEAPAAAPAPSPPPAPAPAPAAPAQPAGFPALAGCEQSLAGLPRIRDIQDRGAGVTVALGFGDEVFNIGFGGVVSR